MGNRTSETRDGVPFTYGHDDNNKLTSLTGGGKSTSFGYDGNGSMTSVSGDMLGSWTLTYDDASRPTSIAYPAGADTYVYNAFGQRTRANLSGSVFRYVYSGDRVLEQTDDSGNLLSRYATAGASYYEPLLEFESPDGSQRYPLYDMVGTARRLADAAGTVTDGASLDAFGRWLGGWGSTESPYLYGAAWGYLTDYSGMQQLGARFYWPEIGRFVQQDPARDGMNWYAYADNEPTIYTDPEGLWQRCVPVSVRTSVDSFEFWEWHQTTYSVNVTRWYATTRPYVVRWGIKWRVTTGVLYVEEFCISQTPIACGLPTVHTWLQSHTTTLFQTRIPVDFQSQRRWLPTADHGVGTPGVGVTWHRDY